MKRAVVVPLTCCVLLLVLAVALLWRPGSLERPASPDPATSPAAAASRTPPAAGPAPLAATAPVGPSPSHSAAPGPAATEDHLHRDVPEDEASWAPAVWDAAARERATARASALIGVWLAVEDVTEPTWRRRSQVLMTAEAAELVRTVDPALLEPGRVTGASRILDEPSPYLVLVEVPTTQGTWRVTLVRESETAPWLAQRWEPLAGGGDRG